MSDFISDVCRHFGRNRAREGISHRKRIGEFLDRHPSVDVDDFLLDQGDHRRPPAISEDTDFRKRYEDV